MSASQRYQQYLTEIPTDETRLAAQITLEYEWAKFVAEYLGFTPDPRPLVIDDTLIRSCKFFEKKTNHDVKGIEMAVAERFFTSEFRSLIHIALTSEDTNSFGISKVMCEGFNVIRKSFDLLIEEFKNLKERFHNVEIVARTHGQPAMKEGMNYIIDYYINNLVKIMDSIPYPNIVKFGGAIGNFKEGNIALKLNGYDTTFDEIAEKFFESFEIGKTKFVRESSTFQTTSYIDKAQHFSQLKILSIFIEKIDEDFWRMISRKDVLMNTGNTVGSSVMPQKQNPINFENSQGNCSLFKHLVDTFIELINFRDQRDLRDSTIQRNIPLLYSYLQIAIQVLIKGLKQIHPNPENQNEDAGLDGAAIQTYLRIKNIGNECEDPYEIMRKLTQGVNVTKNEMFFKIRDLIKNDDHLSQLLNFKPDFENTFIVNTGNKNKAQEFKKFFDFLEKKVIFTNHEVKEPQGKHLEVLRYKASTVPQTKGVYTLCEDTALFVGERYFGPNIKHHIEELSDFVGHKAKFVVALGYYDEVDDKVKYVQGIQDVVIVEKKGDGGFGFDNRIATAEDPTKTFAEYKPASINPRYRAVELLTRGHLCIAEPLREWSNDFQQN